MPRGKKFRSSPPTVNASLTYLQSSYTQLRNIITQTMQTPNSHNTNPVMRHGIHALHAGITVLLTTLGIEHTTFIQNGLRTAVIWEQKVSDGGDEMDEMDEILVVENLLDMVKVVVNEEVPQKRALEGDAQAGRVQIGASSKIQRKGHEGVANGKVMNSSEITAADGKTSNVETQSQDPSAVTGTLHKVETATRVVGDNEHSIIDKNGEVKIHLRAVGRVKTEIAPMMINLETHELVIDPAVAHLTVVEHPPPDNARPNHVNQEHIVGSEIPDPSDVPNADTMEIDYVPAEAPMIAGANLPQDGFELVEIIHDMLEEIGDLLDESNSLIFDDGNELLLSEPVILSQNEGGLNGNGRDTDKES